MPEQLTFVSGGERCAAWLYRPATDGAGTAPSPCVVMAHGFSLTRHDRLPLFAERFAEAGLAVLLFDYRFLGDSGGEPRQRVRLSEQREDFRNAHAFAAGLEGVDPERMVVWGYSMSGGHLARLLADRDLRPAAAIFLAPFVDGLRRVRTTPVRALAQILPAALLDFAGPHRTIPATGQPGEPGAMTLPGEADGFRATVDPPSPWRNAASAGVFAAVPFHRPWRRAGRIQCPAWVGRGDRDISTDGDAVAGLAARAPLGELHDYPGDHFDLLAAGQAGQAGRIAEDQVAFLARQGLAA